MDFFVAHDATLADIFSAGFKLRLYKRNKASAVAKHIGHGTVYKRLRNKRKIACDYIYFIGEIIFCKSARVFAFDIHNAAVGTQRHIKLIVPDVHRIDLLCAAAKQTIRKSAR